MKSTYIILFLILAFITECQLIRGRQEKGKKRCYKVYQVKKGRCSNKIGRYTIQDCCNSNNGGQAYRTTVGGKRQCVPCKTRVTHGWSNWGSWSKCNVDCGTGVISRERRCRVRRSSVARCPGNELERKTCVHKTIPNCPVHGGWSLWVAWTTCSKTCGKGGQRLRFRSCSNPEPKYGGQQCQGDKEQRENCDTQIPCPIHGEWGQWGQWGECNVDCDIGYRYRTRKCNNPAPKYGGKQCNESHHIDKESCDTGCPCDDLSGSGSGASSGCISRDSSGSISGDGDGSISGDGGGDSDGSISGDSDGSISGDGGDDSGDGGGDDSSGSANNQNDDFTFTAG